MKERTIDTLPLDGGWLCLDFINTVNDYTKEESFDFLTNYYDVLNWSEKVSLVPSSKRKELKSYVHKHPEQAKNAFNYLIEGRNTLYELFFTIAQNKIPNQTTQDNFNIYLTEAMGHLHLKVIQPHNIQPQWEDCDDLKYPIYLIIKSAYDLLTSDMLDRVKECGECGWLFLDQSKNKSRKWCSMDTCGSNVKAKRYYHRRKKGN